ncbi:cilia- and flagella-associated protein 206 [Nelusetta ayraudi]|uniref:cilia- and flagella-associated protein 206 n=1 Tax=Nelusetta ayraudi TaxID=303726 RepID=UPI003F70561F
MYCIQEESLIRRIFRGIQLECTMRGHAVSETLVAVMVRAVVLDPTNGFSACGTLTRQDIEKLKDLCLDKLLAECSPSLDTVKMQVYFGTNHSPRPECLENLRRVVESRLSPVSREITDSRAKTREELEALRLRLISYILLRSSMGSPTDAGAVQEATAALQSVLPASELGAFMALPKKDKELQLNELAMLVTGIRLFNRAGGRGQEEADLSQLVPAALNETLPVTGKRIEAELSASRDLAWKYTAVLEKKLADGEAQRQGGETPVALLRQALYNVRQHEVFLKKLLADALVCTKRVDILQGELSSKMKVLRETVRGKTAVHTAQVFPLFKALSKVWYSLEEEAEQLKILHNIMLNLQPFKASQAKLFTANPLDTLVKDCQVKTDEQRASETSAERIVPAEMKTQEWLLPETTVRFDELPLEYNGFCGYTFVTRDGLLLPGNPHIGFLKHKEKLYVFSSREAALKFASNPEDIILKVEEKAQASPELNRLLRLNLQFSNISSSSGMLPGESSHPAKPIIMHDCGAQTELHPVESNIDRSYEWNEWQLRRKAIKLADLQSKETHSTQTILSHLRRENSSQTWLPGTVASQTKRDGKSNVPRPHVYLAGLRGQRDGRVEKIILTRPVDE